LADGGLEVVIGWMEGWLVAGLWLQGDGLACGWPGDGAEELGDPSGRRQDRRWGGSVGGRGGLCWGRPHGVR
jgi:hypothetical protein